MREELFVAGQLSGVEGYTDSSASGILAGINALRVLRGEEPVVPPRETAVGALSHYVANASPEGYQPMNINFGLLPPLEERVRGRRRRRERAVERALAAFDRWLVETGLAPGWAGPPPPSHSAE
jgi:methylenetetrahydrofolate--tRNA-(uracil-5-)-methyltransferase